MQRSLIAAIAIIVILVIALATFVFLYYEAIQPAEPKVEQIPLLYRGRFVTMQAYPGAYLSLAFHANLTLFDCKLTISYQAVNGTQVVVTRDLGVVDQSDDSQFTGFELSDYDTKSRSVDVEFTEANPPDTLQINAFGYKTPNAMT